MYDKKPLPQSVLRHNARRKLVQALYQWDVNRTPVSELHAQFLTHDIRDPERDKKDPPGMTEGLADPMRSADKLWFGEVLKGVLSQVPAVDALITPAISRPMDKLTPVERAILRLSVYELAHCPDIQYRIVINEGIELAKEFGASESHRFINGVLDRLAPEIRPDEPGIRRR